MPRLIPTVPMMNVPAKKNITTAEWHAALPETFVLRASPSGKYFAIFTSDEVHILAAMTREALGALLAAGLITSTNTPARRAGSVHWRKV